MAKSPRGLHRNLKRPAGEVTRGVVSSRRASRNHGTARDARRAAGRQLLQGIERGLRQGWAVDQHRLHRRLQPPGAAALTVAVGGKQPQIGSQLLRRPARLQGGGHGHDVQTQAKPLV